MSTGDVVFLVICWLVLSFVICIFMAGDTGGGDDLGPENKHYAIAFFWPVTVPIMLVFGLLYALWSVFAMCIGWFRG